MAIPQRNHKQMRERTDCGGNATAHMPKMGMPSSPLSHQRSDVIEFAPGRTLKTPIGPVSSSWSWTRRYHKFQKWECHEARDTSRLSSRSWPLPSWHSLFFPNHIKMFGRHYRFPHNGEPRSGCNIKIMSRWSNTFREFSYRLSCA